MRYLHPELFHHDFVDFLHCLDRAKVESILVGGYAVVLHGYHRVTGDLDIWVKPTEENYLNLMQAFAAFGLPQNAISQEEFLDVDTQDVFTFGRPPVALDLLTKVKGLEFDEAYSKAEPLLLEDSIVRLIHVNDLKEAKRSAGRHKDLDDLENL